MTHTYRAMDGFETQDGVLGQATAGTAPTAEATLASFSRRGARWNLAAGSGYVRYGDSFDTTKRWTTNQVAFWWVSFHIHLSTLPTAGLFYYLGRYNSDLASTESAIRIDDAGHIQIYNDNVATWATSSGTLTAGKKYVISYLWQRNVLVRCIARDRDTGVTVIDVSHGSAPRNRDASSFDIGPYATSTGDVTFDNYAEENDATLANIDDPVNDLTTKYAVGMEVPAGIGSFDQWTGGFADIDEYPNDGDTTGRTETTDTEAFTNTLTKTSSFAAQVGTIKATDGFILMRSGAGTENGEIRFRSGTTNIDGADADIPSSYIDYHVFRTTDPATSSAWTVSAVDAVEIGAVRGPGAGTVRVTEAGVQILYTITVVDRVKLAHFQLGLEDEGQRIFDYSGRELDYDEVRSNRWMRLGDVAEPTSARPESFYDDQEMVYIEAVTYAQDINGESLSIEGSPDYLVPMLLDRIANDISGV